MVKQLREMSKTTFENLGEKTKIKMLNQQFSIHHDEWCKVSNWVEENTNEPYYFELNGGTWWVSFYGSADAVSFKLQWI